MQPVTQTAHTLLKAGVSPHVIPDRFDIGQVLQSFVDDKGYSRELVVQLAKSRALDDLIEDILLRGARTSIRHVYNYFGSRLRNTLPHNRGIRRYRGAPEDAVAADKMLTMLSDQERFVGLGATGFVDIPNYLSLPFPQRNIPIAIIGSGPAGIIIHRALVQIGFRNITIFEKRKPYGIWSQENVVRGSRNNPRAVRFNGIAVLDAAPGDGDEIPAFLSRVQSDTFNSVNMPVRKVIPGNLTHQIVTDSKPFTFPIVINAMGTGKPSPISDPTRMIGPVERVVAKRWQEPQLEHDKVRGKMFILIGLGNSTAEMLRVLHAHQDKGVDVDYRVLTHYPRDAVFNPSDTVVVGNTGYRVFRDISKPQLVSYQGDLPHSRADYYRALLSGRIVSDVKKWDVDGKMFTAYNGRGPANRNKGTQVVPEMRYDQLYILTGYQHSPADLAQMGCIYDKNLRCALHDYDGEIIGQPKALGGDRVHRGYFGFGAVLDAPHNPNTVVIPGMAFRLPDLLFGIVMRAGEHHLRTN